eukprot:TRINITY_DN1229_c0_g1_i13.p1 TRINITY_DN1229_c0_g1~~TRINITY_DN1229_c0_g1_i13.p1  ORF type:complete len:488 (+),score=80.15 TRINITY_DN1229_c0_g1_i13:69-1532(+)
MQVFVKRNSKECDYEINIDWTVKRLKEELTQDFRIDTEKYELTHEGDPMSDNRLLMSYGLVGGSQMLLDLKPSERMKRTLRHECRSFNRAAMLNCCSKGDIKTFEEIRCTGYDLEPEKNPDSKTTHFLTVAVKSRQHKMVEHLLDLGFSSNCSKQYSSWPRYRLQFRIHKEYPLKWAIINNDVQMLELLHSRGCDLDSPKTSWGSTPLFFASSKPEYSDVAKRMITLGADPTVRNSRGHSALSTAVCKGNLEAVKLLMERTSPSGPELSDLYSVATYKLVGKHTEMYSIKFLLEKASNMRPNLLVEKHLAMFKFFEGKKTEIFREKETDPWEKEIGVPTVEFGERVIFVDFSKQRTFNGKEYDYFRDPESKVVSVRVGTEYQKKVGRSTTSVSTCVKLYNFYDEWYRFVGRPEFNEHPHWMYLRRPAGVEERVEQLMELESEIDEHFDFLYSRGNTRGSKSNRYRGKTASRKTHISRKYQKHRAYDV